jgi:hypothetical protein
MANVEAITLTAIRRHIKKYGWNGQYFSTKESNREAFKGQCAYACDAVSEMITNTGRNGVMGDVSLCVRGWYRGEITECHRENPCSNFHPTENKHAHSWVRLPDGRILDPTWWQFTDAAAKVYIFPADDPRFEPDESA